MSPPLSERFSGIGGEVLFGVADITIIDAADIEQLKKLAAANPRHRIRICAHPDNEDRLHEMLIIHRRGNYIPPHKHVENSESFHIIEGALTILLFDEAGRKTRRIDMGAPGTGQVFYYRLPADRYHAVIPRSEWVVFHETTNGPFRRERMHFPAWAPPENDPAAGRAFLATRE